MVQQLRGRVRRIGEQVLAEQHYVRPIDILVGLGWLAEVNAERWQQGRLQPLEQAMLSTMQHHPAALVELHEWAVEKGLRPVEAAYVAPRGGRPLRFSVDENPGLEQAVRTHWYSPELPDPPRGEPIEQPRQPAELVVVSPTRAWTCAVCGSQQERGELLIMEDSGPVCLSCADLDHLEFLPAGNTALTRRTRRHSRLAAVVVRWSRSRRRYERQGILAETSAIEQAEAECLADEEVRERRRMRAAERERELDERFVAELAAAIAAQFPGCPSERAERIARHAGTRSSGRIGRTRAGRELQPDAVRLAVIASIRHEDTDYDELLAAGFDRSTARLRVRDDVERVLSEWQAGPG